MSHTMPPYGHPYTNRTPLDQQSAARYLASELESLSTSSESTASSSTDPGRVNTDFDAVTTSNMDYGWQSFTPGGRSRGARSTRSIPQNYLKSPLRHPMSDEEDDIVERSPSPPENYVPRAIGTVSPFNEYVVPEPQGQVARRSTSITPRASMDIVEQPPIDPERTRKLLEAISAAINWSRALTEVRHMVFRHRFLHTNSWSTSRTKTITRRNMTPFLPYCTCYQSN